MTNLYDNTFWLHVAVGALLITVFSWFLFRSKPKKSRYELTNINRCKAQAKHYLQCINECRTDEELVGYESSVDQFFIDNYELLGYDLSMAHYRNLTTAIIKRRHRLWYEQGKKSRS